MADISMCLDTKCPSRVHCLRFRAIPDKYLQSYFIDTKRGDKPKCEHYQSTAGWDDRDLRSMSDIEERVGVES